MGTVPRLAQDLVGGLDVAEPKSQLGAHPAPGQCLSQDTRRVPGGISREAP